MLDILDDTGFVTAHKSRFLEHEQGPFSDRPNDDN